VTKVSDFEFDERVAEVFDNMVQRSVPFYRETQRMAVELAGFHLADGGVVYDVGCATGTTLAGIAEAVDPDAGVRYVGIEPSAAMRDKARERMASIDTQCRLELWGEGIEELDALPGAQVIAMLYTLQFVRPVQRQAVARMLCRELAPGGCLLLAEKILADDQDARRLFIDRYHAMKRRSGYSDTEIEKKREALENVLVPFTNSENVELLRDAGFGSVEVAFRWYNFALYYAIKR
jgi:tRNA (cmo5U34)-methyltransferase